MGLLEIVIGKLYFGIPFSWKNMRQLNVLFENVHGSNEKKCEKHKRLLTFQVVLRFPLIIAEACL